MNARTLVDGAALAQVPADDRGLLYGDGVFETMLFAYGRAPLWSRHMSRLRESCARLAIPISEESVLAGECAALIAGIDRAVVRITITRGSGERGYAVPQPAQARRIVGASPALAPNADWYRDGIRVRWCATQCAAQPRLAGIKHLNRLEQVLARAEWNDAAIGEGLMCDANGSVVGATAANVFAVIAGTLVTPAVDHCGVAGVMRAQVLEWSPDAHVRVLGMDELMQASEVFLTNALRGVVPVRALDDTTWSVGPRAHALIARCRAFGILPQVAS